MQLSVRRRRAVSVAALFALLGCAGEPDGALDDGAPALQLSAVRAAAPDAGLGPEVRARVERDLARSPDGLERVQRADGLEEVLVRRGFRHATLAVAGGDGGVRQRCLTDAREATTLLERGSE